MIVIRGEGISGGIAGGPLYFRKHNKENAGKIYVRDTGAEKERLDAARERSVSQLDELAARCREESGDEMASLFETYSMLVEDEGYVKCMNNILETEHCNAEYAVKKAGEQVAEIFSEMEDPYMSARAADIRDVSDRITWNLADTHAERGMECDVPYILASEDLSASEVMQLDRSKVTGIITQRGSDISHAAILARSIGIPSVCGLGDDLREEYNGREVWMDGDSGLVCIDPDETEVKFLRDKYDRQREQTGPEEAADPETPAGDQEEVSGDGIKTEICCNISSVDDIAAVKLNGGDGIGLFRSEFLFLTSDHWPTEDEQYEVYKTAAEAMEGRRVIIRTLDIGGDKKPEYAGMKEENNPAMGLRGIRFCLKHPEVLKTQLRAIYRASAYGNIAVMFPMITSVWEAEECRRMCKSVMEELKSEGKAFDPDTEAGIMIETPASVFIADDLAKIADFFFGTNDLTQYILAWDRTSSDPGKFYDARHPALLRAIKAAADAAHSQDIRVGICGELASDTDMLPEFLEMGIDELSVVPSAVPSLRAALRRSTAKPQTPD